MSSCNSSSDSKSSSSSSSEDSSSDSEDEECKSSPDPGNYISEHPTMSIMPQCRIPEIVSGQNKHHDNNGLLVNTLSKYTLAWVIGKVRIHSGTTLIMI